VKFPARALTPSQPNNRGRYNLRMESWSVSLTALRALERLSLGRYRWPICAANDGDHATW
jgi:hypothetical protein